MCLGVAAAVVLMALTFAGETVFFSACAWWLSVPSAHFVRQLTSNGNGFSCFFLLFLLLQ